MLRYNKLLIMMEREDGNNHLAQSGAGKFGISVSNGLMLYSRIRGPNRSLMIFDFFERHGAKYSTRRNPDSSIVRNVKPFSREYSSPWQCHLVPIQSHPTSALCSNLTGAISGLMQKQS